MSTCRFIIGDVREVVASMKPGSVDLIMTSPPFLSLRSYLPDDHPDKALEIGSEATPEAFLDTMLGLTTAWGDVLSPWGSIAVEFGDTYSGSGGHGGDYNEGGLRDGQPRFEGSARAARRFDGGDSNAYGTGRAPRPARKGNGRRDRAADVAAGILAPTKRPGPEGRDSIPGWPLDKSLAMIPSLYAASLAYGRNLLNPDHTFEPWRVRNFVAWVRSNPPVGALGDKIRPATSYVTWACRAGDRYFDLDAVRTPSDYDRPNLRGKGARGGDAPPGQRPNRSEHTTNPRGAPPLDWWKIAPGGYKGAHYAVFPEELCRIPIEASCPRRVCLSCGQPSRRITAAADDYADKLGASWADKTEGRGKAAGGARTHHAGQPVGEPHIGSAQYDTLGWTTCGCAGTDGLRLDGFHTGSGWRPGVVLDPFGGSGTVGVVATGRSRDCILIDLDERNAELAYQRIGGMFLEVEHFARQTA